MRKNGVPRKVRGDRAREISKGLTQILRHAAPRLNIAMGEDGFVDMGAEIIDVIHHNHKSRFEVRPEDGTYSVRALQGHSISHVRDDLIQSSLWQTRRSTRPTARSTTSTRASPAMA